MIKRLADLALAAAALMVLMPVIAAVALAVAWKMGRPVVFTQQRIGLHGRPFTLMKFRTMRDAYDAEGCPLPDARRLTPLGRWLRRTSLDELPELFNVVRGDMSLVGPRPLLPQYLPRYDARQARRHNVRPGLTGLAQISGRNRLSWEQRLELDVQYVERHSLALDARILGRTIAAVLTGDGVSQPGHETSEEFMGNAEGKPDVR